MREVDIERTAYPQLPLNITDREVIERYTLEPEELSLVRGYRGDSLTFAIRLKVFGHLLSHNLPLSEAPQRVVDYIASQFQEKPETLSESKDSQDDYILKRAEAKQQGEDLYEQLLEIIVESSSKDEIVDNIFALHSYEEYKSLLSTLRQLKKPKKVQYFETIQAKYSFVRRFTPLVWENLTFRSNTSDDTLVRAMHYRAINR